MTALHRNLEALSTVHPDAVQQLELSDGAVAELQLSAAPDGSPIANYHGRWLHSTRDPRREAARVADSPTLRHADLIVCYGFGLAYQLEAITQKHPATPIVVIEPDLPLLRAALRLRPLDRLLALPQLTVIAGSDADAALAATLSSLRPRRPAVKRLRASVEAHPELFAAADEAISRHNARDEINRNTLKRFGRLWVRNLVRNITVVPAAPGVARLARRFSGMAAVVCAAGPTLDDLLQWLPALHERAVIIAVDTSIVPLLRAGITPDFLVTVDPQYWNTRHLDRLHSPATALISESATHPRVFRMLPHNPRYLCSSLFPLGRYLERNLEPRGTLGAGGSVATSAWDFARVLGCTPVYTAGLDLGFPGHVTHCRGSFFEELAHGFCSRFMPVERYAAQYLWDGGPRTTQAADGTSLLSDQRMLLYKWWFESQIENASVRHSGFFSLSARGIAIEGMPPIAPAHALAALEPARGAIDETLCELHDESSAYPSAQAAAESSDAVRHALDTDLASLVDELTALDSVLQPAVRAAERAKAQHRADPNAQLDLSELDRADRAIATSERREIIGFLIHETAEQIFAASDETGEHALENSRQLYEALADSAVYHSRLLSEARQRLSRA